MEYYRIDFIFSYWIFIWFLFYLIGAVKIAPTLLIYLGTIANTGELFYLFYSKAPKYNLIKFTIINSFLKLFPLYFVWKKRITIYEIKVSTVLLVLYIIWIRINRLDPYYFYIQFLNNYKTGEGKKTIVSEYYDRLINQFLL